MLHTLSLPLGASRRCQLSRHLCLASFCTNSTKEVTFHEYAADRFTTQVISTTTRALPQHAGDLHNCVCVICLSALRLQHYIW